MDGCFDEGCRGKWLASWGSHILSTRSHHLFCSKPSTLASRAEPLAIVWSYHSPDEHLLGTQAALFLKYAKCPPTLSFHTGLFFCFHCSSAWIPHQGSLPLLGGLALCSRSLQATFPSLPASQNISPADSPSIPFGLFYFRTSLPDIEHVFCCLSPPPEHKLQSVETDFVHLQVASNYHSRTRHVLNRRATDTLGENRDRICPNCCLSLVVLEEIKRRTNKFDLKHLCFKRLGKFSHKKYRNYHCSYHWRFGGMEPIIPTHKILRRRRAMKIMLPRTTWNTADA